MRIAIQKKTVLFIEKLVFVNRKYTFPAFISNNLYTEEVKNVSGTFQIWTFAVYPPEYFK